MVEFVVNVWNQFASPIDFENEIPLLANGRRMAALGIKNRIQICFLEGFEKLPSRYLDQVKELGFVLHDVSKLAFECASLVPSLIDIYKRWGGIKHFGLIRFLTMPRFYGKTSIITFDGDMIINSSLDEIEHAIGNTFCFLSNSSCFGSLPQSCDFFDVFESHLLRLVNNPDDYARSEMKLESSESFFDPFKSGGTDQAFILHLFRQGLLAGNNAFDILAQAGMVGFSNWLLLDELGLGDLTYERISGVDYVGGKKVLISHMSHDTCIYFGQFLFLHRWLGEDGMKAFGRIPIVYDHYKRSGFSDPELIPFFKKLIFLTERYKNVRHATSNPLLRTNVVEHFYDRSDFSGIFSDQVWHTPGVFR